MAGEISGSWEMWTHTVQVREKMLEIESIEKIDEEEEGEGEKRREIGR